MRGGTRLPGPRRLLRSLATWGVTRQKKALQVALLDNLRPDHTWTPRQTRRWWRRGFTKLARQTQQQREAQVQTVGVSYHHPDYFEEAKKKGLVLYMDHRHGANQRLPSQSNKGPSAHHSGLPTRSRTYGLGHSGRYTGGMLGQHWRRCSRLNPKEYLDGT